MHCLSVPFKVGRMIKSGTTLFADHILCLQVDLVYVLREVGVPTPAMGAFRLCPLVNHPNMLSQVRIFFPTRWTRAAELVVHIHNVSLQVSLQVASIATITTFEVFQLNMLLVDM